MKQQATLFFTALQFYTRIPAPHWLHYKPENLNRATGYLPLIGWIVGLIAGCSWLVGAYLTNVNTGLLLSMAASVLATGAFHEDGFADVCDGFGGGWTKDKILEIMKDSRIGTYGSVGLMLLLTFKFLLLQNLSLQSNSDFMILISLLVSAHAWSRWMPVLVIFTRTYARADQDSKAKPVAEGTNLWSILTGSVFALVPVLFLAGVSQSPLIFICGILPAILTFALARYFTKWIGGYTGDCLGAIQQVSEVTFYLSITVFWKFI